MNDIVVVRGGSSEVRVGSRLFSNSGRGVKLSVNILAGCRVLSAVDTVSTVNRHFD